MNKDSISSLISGIVLIFVGISCTWQVVSVTEKAIYLSIMGIEITPNIINVSGPYYNYSTRRPNRDGKYDEHFIAIIKYLNYDEELRIPTFINNVNVRIVYAKKYPKLYMNSSQGRDFFTLVFQRYTYIDSISFTIVALLSLYVGCFFLSQLYWKHTLHNETNAS